MAFRKSIWLGAAVLAASILGTPRANAQQIFDFSTFMGTNGREGRNADPVHTSPGRSNLRWVKPNGFGYSYRFVSVDNTDTNPQPVDPVDGFHWYPNPYGDVARTGVWTDPPADGQPGQANPSYTPLKRPKPFDDNGTTAPANTQFRTPPYVYARCTPSAADDVTQSATGNLRTFSWTFRGDAIANQDYETYAVYVHLPAGPTGTGAAKLFPQRYFVYEIRTGVNGEDRYVEKLDTYVAGDGWIRLGGGGFPTSRVFGFQPGQPIIVRLLNTVPRKSDGSFTMPTNSDTGERGLDRYCVYADAVRFEPQHGTYDASPTAMRLVDNDPTTTTLTSIENLLSAGVKGGSSTSIQRGEVTNRVYNTGEQRWRYQPGEENGYPVPADNNGAMAGTFNADPLATHYSGDDAGTAAIVTDPNAVPLYNGTVTYAPTLEDETYDVYVYLPGDGPDATHKYGKAVMYEVRSAQGTYRYFVDQSQPRGWVRLGGRRFRNDNAGQKLEVMVTNYSNDPTDAARYAYADAARFVGEADYSIRSSPIHATANIKLNDGTVVEKKVVVVADENGFLHCLDAIGNPDGTTTEYWSYPSRKDTAGYDPNLGANDTSGLPDFDGPATVPQQDRFPTAEMPLGFNLSSGLVQRINGQDYLFIGSENGRVYCISMTGRGDYNSVDPVSGGRHISGTTLRVWTYPATYPSQNPFPTSDLGPISGSISYGAPGNVPTIFIPTQQGRVFAINAVGNPTDKSTQTAWTFPAKTADNLGPIVSTPAYRNGQLYFGTAQKITTSGALPGRFYSINASNGTQSWVFPTNAQLGSSSVYSTLDFLSSPALADGSELSTTDPNANPSVVFTANQNAFVYSLNINDGSIVWATNELQTGCTAPLTFTWQVQYNSARALQAMPVVLIPTEDGRFQSMMARQGDVTRDADPLGDIRFQPRAAGGRTVAGGTVKAGIAVQGLAATDPDVAPSGWMYGGDSYGNLYAFNNDLGTVGNYNDLPGAEIIPANDIRGDVFRKVKMGIIDSATFQRLRLPTGQNFSYSQAVGMIQAAKALEWGQTAYLLVYDFPFDTEDSNGNAIDPPIINVSFNVGGKTVRGIAVQSRQFASPATSPTYNSVQPTDQTLPPPDGDTKMDGYAIVAFPLQNAGANSLPPGNVEVSATLSTAALNPNNVQQNISLNPRYARVTFPVANPLGVYVGSSPTLPGVNNPLGIGLSNDPTHPENLGNGSFDVVGDTYKKSRLTSSAGLTSHGGTAQQTFYLVDRSMMALLRPEGLTQGLDNVRIYRRDLAWQGGKLAVIKPLDPALYPNYEDLPENFPNNSLDYPDIRREQLKFTKDPNASAENPVFQPVTLLPPLERKNGTLVAMDENTRLDRRVFRGTPVQVDVNVPRYQPPNNLRSLSALNPSALQSNSANSTNFEQGYIGRFDVFVDTSPNGRMDTSVGEAYRSLNISAGVNVDERMSVTTPTVDLGDLAAGTGYDPSVRPGAAGTALNTGNLFQPWFDPFSSLFRPFGVANEGNVNMRDVRLAKISFFNSAFDVFRLPSSVNDMRAFLDSRFDMWSDVDPAFGIGPDTNHKVILPKPRVQDRVPTKLQSNPKRRQNANLGVTGSVQIGSLVVDDVLNKTLTSDGSRLAYQHPQLRTQGGVYSPVVGTSVPIGMPVGKYSEYVRVYENDNGNAGLGNPLWDNANNTYIGAGPEPYSQPGFLLSFNVTETRLTNGPTNAFTSPMLDATQTGTTRNANIQPTAARDAFGSLIMAWASNRPDWDATVTDPSDVGFRIYVASLDNSSTFSSNGFSGPNFTQTGPNSIWSPLRDLNGWRAPNSGQWFRQNGSMYPSGNAAGLFGVPNANVLPGTMRFGNPSFPTLGADDPFNPGNRFTGMYMAFTGQAQHRNADNSVQNDSRLFMTVATPTNTGAVSLSATPAVVNDDPQSVKGKPTVVQVGGSGTSKAIVLYPVISAGQSNILYARFDGQSFAQPVGLPFGSGFSSVGAPSAVGRLLRPGTGTQKPVVELTFQGRLKGRPYPEIFLARLNTSGPNGAVTQDPDRLLEDAMGNLDQARVFDAFPEIGNEVVTAEAEAGLYRARGVQWAPGTPVALTQILNGVATNLLLSPTAVYDQRTGIFSFETRLGGKVYMDPAVGTLRFTNAVPSRNARLYLTYTPRFLRISAGGSAGYNDPTGLYDGRLITDASFWRDAAGAQATLSTNNVVGRRLSNDRMIFTYNRAAAGTGQAARPFIQTMRLGVNLPYRLPTLNDGTPGVVINGNAVSPIVGMTFADGGAGDAFQLDPARVSATGGYSSSGSNGENIDPAKAGQGAVYFPSIDEGRVVTISHYAVDESGQLIMNGPQPAVFNTTATIALIPERTESPLPIQTAVNESGLLSFLDPFTYDTERRPPTVWLVWTSTRNGTPDLYFESIAPRWTPILTGR